MTYDDCYKLDCMEILEIMHRINEDVAKSLHSVLAYHVCANLSEKVTHCLFVSVLYAVLKVKEQHMEFVQSYSLN